MRKLPLRLSLLALSLLPLASFAQQDLFRRYIGRPDTNEVCNGAFRTNNGKVLFTGFRDLPGAGGANNRDIVIYKVDANGNMLFQRALGSDSLDNGYSVTENANGDVAICGWTRSQGNDALLTVLNGNDGTPLTLRSFGGTGDDRVFAVAPRGTSGAFMVGQSNSFGATDAELFLMGADDAGNLDFAFTLGGPGVQTASQMIPTVIDEAIVFGNTGGTKGLIATVNTLNGTVTSQMSIGTTGNDVASRLVPIPGGGFFLVGTTDVNGDQDFMVIKLDASMATLWGITLDSGGDDRGLSATLDDNNDLVVVGHTNVFGGQEGTIFKVDGTGSFQWGRRTSTSNKTADGDTTESLYFIENVPGVGFRIIGTTTGSGTAGFNDILEMQTDTEGNVGCDTENLSLGISSFTPVVNTNTGLTVTNVTAQVTTTDLTQGGSVEDTPINHPVTDECRTTVSRPEAVAAQSLFAVQPNPASGSFHVALNQPGAFQLQVVDLMGRTVYATQGTHTNGQPQRVEASAWNTGVYLVRITQNGQTATQRVVVQ